MAGKRSQADLRGVDKNSPEYWNEVLGREGLSMARGTSTHLVYVGESAVLERIEGERRTDDGRVGPHDGSAA